MIANQVAGGDRPANSSRYFESWQISVPAASVGTHPGALASALLAAQRRLHSLDITAWQDARVTPEIQRAYVGLAESGQLTARVVGALWWDRARGRGNRSASSSSERVTVGRFRSTSVKIMQDGVGETSPPPCHALPGRLRLPDREPGAQLRRPGALCASTCGR